MNQVVWGCGPWSGVACEPKLDGRSLQKIAIWMGGQGLRGVAGTRQHRGERLGALGRAGEDRDWEIRGACFEESDGKL